MRKSIVGLTILLVLVVSSPGMSQAVLFNWPAEWLTQRDNVVEAKVILDTARVNGKRVELELFVSRDGKSQRTGRQTFKVSDYTKDVKLGKIPGPLFGGNDYAKVKWSVQGSEESGEIGPIGVVALHEIRPIDSLVAKKVTKDITCEMAKSLIADDEFVTVGSIRSTVRYNDEHLILVVNKPEAGSKGKIVYAVDGKNAKSSFVAYADRFVSYDASSDSVTFFHYDRYFKGEKVGYQKTDWFQEIDVENGKECVVIRIPWYDLGMTKPFAGRRFGFTMMSVEKDSDVKASFPDEAAYFLPGSWGNVICGE